VQSIATEDDEAATTAGPCARADHPGRAAWVAAIHREGSLATAGKPGSLEAMAHKTTALSGRPQQRT